MKIVKVLKNLKYTLFFVLILVAIVIVLLDYGANKIIPNFFFLDVFSEENVEAYWMAVINILIVAISILTFLQTSDKFFFEKRIHNENQKKETIRRYQDLVRTAIEIFNEKIEDEGACLFAVQIMQNIVSLYEEREFTRTLEKQSEPFQIISIEGVVCLLKKHLDRVWSIQRPDDEIRQDVIQVIRLLYIDELCSQENLKNCGVKRFKNAYINMNYFDNLSLDNMEFVNVIFSCKSNYIKMVLDGCNVFEECIFNCDYNIYLKEYGNIIFKKCELQDFKMIEYNEIMKNKNKIHGRKVIKFIETVCKGYIVLSDNIFAAVIIESSEFENMVYMHRIKVSSEMIICDSKFLGGLDFQESIFEWKIRFKNSICKDLFYFWGTKFYKKGKVDFFEFYIDNFPVPNWKTEIYEDKYQSNRYIKKYYFEDLYELVNDEEAKTSKLVNKDF